MGLRNQGRLVSQGSTLIYILLLLRTKVLQLSTILFSLKYNYAWKYSFNSYALSSSLLSLLKSNGCECMLISQQVVHFPSWVWMNYFECIFPFSSGSINPLWNIHETSQELVKLSGHSRQLAGSNGAIQLRKASIGEHIRGICTSLECIYEFIRSTKAYFMRKLAISGNYYMKQRKIWLWGWNIGIGSK